MSCMTPQVHGISERVRTARCEQSPNAPGRTFALKTMPPDLELHGDEDTALRKLLEDVEMQRSLEHPNIAPVSGRLP